MAAARPNMYNKSSASSAANSIAATKGDARALQDSLHDLLKHLAATSELIKAWPESEGDDASIHVETTTKLLGQIQKVISTLQRVEGIVKTDAILRKSLQDCLIPMDLLDLLDFTNGLNPDCFSRGLLREALGQLAGLKRRKMALEMLGTAVQEGLNKRMTDYKTTSSTEAGNSKGGTNQNNKRLREEGIDNESSTEEPPLKKLQS